MIKRILEDQYKPLRIKGYQKPIPRPAPLPNALFDPDPSTATSGSSSSSERDRPKMPWEFDTTFKAPDNYNPSVAPGFRTGGVASPYAARLEQVLNKHKASGSSTSTITTKMVGGGDGKANARETAGKVRLVSAYERTLDYKAGSGRPGSSQPAVHVPSNEDGDSAGNEGELMAGEMRVYEGFIEEKIKKARKQGLFRVVQGRGKPIARDEAEGNPYISRSDFLINRIMKAQDAAPPWIELQKELESSLVSFRTNLSQNWTRRAIRIRSSEGLTPAVVREVQDGWRDPEWEHKEKRYHETAIQDINDLMRKYNVIAPYHVRRPLITLPAELARVVRLSAPTIASELSRRLSLGLHTTPSTVPLDEDELDEEGRVRSLTADEMGGERKAVKESMWKAFRRVVVEVLGKAPDEAPISKRA
ncbi:hypothetical protein JCM10212_002935 [Sporobolomyces blumeae]